MSLAGRKAFVTGAATGIGHAIAVRLAGRRPVTLADRDGERVAAAAADSPAPGRGPDAVTLDMTSFDAVGPAIARAAGGSMGGLDVPGR